MIDQQRRAVMNWEWPITFVMQLGLPFICFFHFFDGRNRLILCLIDYVLVDKIPYTFQPYYVK